MTAGRGGEQLCNVFDHVEILMTMIMIRVMMMIKLDGSVEHPNFLIVLSLSGQNTSLICQLNSPNRRNLMQKIKQQSHMPGNRISSSLLLVALIYDVRK